MGKTTGIAWTTSSWNPWQGCTKVSDGCKNCYMYREKKRYGQDPFTVVRSKPATFNAPLKWNLPEGSRIFVCSWSDFFHEDADSWREEAWNIIASLPQYSFLIPTKRPERIHNMIGQSYWYLENVWLGISVENQKTFDERITYLLDIPAIVHWISAEPLLGRIDLDILGKNYGRDFIEWSQIIDWVVVGGESGPNARPMDIKWARDLREQCQVANKPFFMKQLGGYPYSRHELKDFPEDLQIREFPE